MPSCRPGPPRRHGAGRGLDQPDGGIPGEAARRDARAAGLRGARDAHPGALALLEAPLLPAVPPSNRDHGSKDREYGQRSAGEERQTTARTGRDPPAGSEDRAKPDEEVSSSAFPRFPQRSAAGATPALLRIRRRLPGSGRSVEIGGPARPVSDRQLSASSPVRQGVLRGVPRTRVARRSEAKDSNHPAALPG